MLQRFCQSVEDDPIKAGLWELAENLHRCDLTKEQRDEHIRRYAELRKKQRAEARVIVPQEAAKLPPAPVGRPKSVAREIVEATGLSDDTVRRGPQPAINMARPRFAPLRPITLPKSRHRSARSCPAELCAMHSQCFPGQVASLPRCGPPGQPGCCRGSLRAGIGPCGD